MSEDKGEKPRRQHRFKITSKKVYLQSNPIDARARDNDSQMMQSSHLLEEGIVQHKRIRSESRPKLHDYQDDANRTLSHNDGNASGETRAERFVHRRSKSSRVNKKKKEKKPIPLNRPRRSPQAPPHVPNDVVVSKSRTLSEPPNTRTLGIVRFGEGLRTDEGSRCNYSEVQEKSPRDVKPKKKGGSTHSFLASPKTSKSISKHSISKDTSYNRVHAKNATMPKQDTKDQHNPTGSTSNISSKSRRKKKINVSPKENSREKSPPKAAHSQKKVIKAKSGKSPPPERRSSGEKCSILDAVIQHGFEKKVKFLHICDLSMSKAKVMKSPISKESSPKAPRACIPGYRFINRCARCPSTNRQNFFGNLVQ
ncbi:hypothetical protein Bpfe_009008, partial [Biomphalaria pfeifferi]